MPHFLEMVLTDEITRRDRASASVRARTAHLDPTMVVEAWDDTAKVSFDKAMWAELVTLASRRSCLMGGGREPAASRLTGTESLRNTEMV